MSSDMLPIHISIYVKNKESKSHRDQYKIVYEVEDNDKSLIFTPDFSPKQFIVLQQMKRKYIRWR